MYYCLCFCTRTDVHIWTFLTDISWHTRLWSYLDKSLLLTLFIIFLFCVLFFRSCREFKHTLRRNWSNVLMRFMQVTSSNINTAGFHILQLFLKQTRTYQLISLSWSTCMLMKMGMSLKVRKLLIWKIAMFTYRFMMKTKQRKMPK